MQRGVGESEWSTGGSHSRADLHRYAPRSDARVTRCTRFSALHTAIRAAISLCLSHLARRRIAPGTALSDCSEIQCAHTRSGLYAKITANTTPKQFGALTCLDILQGRRNFQKTRVGNRILESPFILFPGRNT